jgi:hypothetical protein
MRSTSTSTRGRIALIRKGSGKVVGFAELVDSMGPLNSIAWRAHRDMHCIPHELDHAQQRWPHAWVLHGATPLARPVPYEHPSGAVIWVNLSQEVAHACEADVASATLRMVSPMPTSRSRGLALASSTAGAVPFARDGSCFGAHLRRAGGFTIGAKDAERGVAGYLEALEVLRRMRPPCWRRPNGAGNWGIVTGVEWRAAPAHSASDQT